jgi:hypothetical protein
MIPYRGGFVMTRSSRRESTLLTSEAARVLGRSAARARQLFDRGVLPGERLPNGLRLFDRAAVEAFRERQAQRTERR